MRARAQIILKATPTGHGLKVLETDRFPARLRKAYIVSMPHEIEIVHVERDSSDGIVVTFSDGTVGAYVVEELLELRPHREPVRLPKFIPSARNDFEKL
jgi:hypothetical protein